MENFGIPQKKIVAKAAPGAYIALSGMWFILGVCILLIFIFKPTKTPWWDFSVPVFLFSIGGLWVVCLRGLKLEIDGDFFIYRNWFYVESKFELEKISKIKEGWFEIRRKIGKNTNISGIKIKYDGKFIIINTKPFGGENYREIVFILKKTAENFQNPKEKS